MNYPYYPGSQSQPFEVYGLPTPNQSTNAQSDTFAPLTNYDENLHGLDPSLRLNPSSSFVSPPHSSPELFIKHSATGSDVPSNQRLGDAPCDGDEIQFADPSSLRSSSEEKEPDSAQSKRKAQNRAAYVIYQPTWLDKPSNTPTTNVFQPLHSQRAFRERKERHVRDLEDKVNDLEQTSQTLEADNERLKRELAKYTTENEILRATSHHTNHTPVNVSEDQELTVTGPMRFSPTDFYSALMPNGHAGSHSSPPHRLIVCPVTGEKLLDSGATWEFVQQHELFKLGQVDIVDVIKRLQGMAQCDGQGPAFRVGQVRLAIEESAAMGRDELI
ncbi:hypothetical protein N7457_008951 [Penicillium paradoxum]|uniref:uncharacterized protein n=1 Tax=Penicillium paradoxum TaxID=176176 RepID=UPI0025499D72|nr:uncharacterized protein N7457_008951 [Penicillium paradoxum]KAJ5774055.1 hypothetical protein N7457_008951 [Penicillium paradoxum]